MPWRPALAARASPKFRALARRITAAVDGLCAHEPALPGWRTATRVLAFRRGSVVADLQLRSVGPATTRPQLLHRLRACLDVAVSQRTSLFPGAGLLLPEHYRFAPDGAADRALALVAASNAQQQLAEPSLAPAPESRGVMQQPAVLGAVITGVLALVVLAALVVLYCLYRARKADEGSYALNNKPKLASTPLVGHAAADGQGGAAGGRGGIGVAVGGAGAGQHAAAREFFA